MIDEPIAKIENWKPGEVVFHRYGLRSNEVAKAATENIGRRLLLIRQTWEHLNTTDGLWLDPNRPGPIPYTIWEGIDLDLKHWRLVTTYRTILDYNCTAGGLILTRRHTVRHINPIRIEPAWLYLIGDRTANEPDKIETSEKPELLAYRRALALATRAGIPFYCGWKITKSERKLRECKPPTNPNRPLPLTPSP